MKTKTLIHSIILCICSLGVTIYLNAANELGGSMPLQQDFSEVALLDAFNQLQQIDTLIAQLALLVTNDSIKNIPNPKDVIRIFKDIRTLIGNLSHDQAEIIAMKNPELNMKLTLALTQICEALNLYLEKGIAQKLKNLKPFDINQLMKRSPSSLPTRPAMIRKLQSIGNKIESLKILIDNVGLTWYNKLARKADNYIVTPANKYHIPTISFYAGGAGLIGTYLLWLYGKNFKGYDATPDFIKKLIDTIYEKTGEPMSNNMYQLKDDDDDDNHPFAVAEFAVRQTLSNQNPLVNIAGGAFLHSFIEETWKKRLKPAIAENISVIWNYLRGGAYLEQQSPGIFAVEPTVNFDNMVGLDEVKKEFSTIIQYLENPELFANMKTSPEKGWLLTGPKRTGKSFSFECLCGEIVRSQKKRGITNKFTFWNIDASIIHEKGIKTILYYAQQEGPMVLFIDEIDLLNVNRTGDLKMLNEFLTGIQSSKATDPSKLVIIIAATNKPQTLDPALRASGRLGKEIRFEYPSKKHRVEYITKELTSMALDIEAFDINTIAEKTDQRSFEDLSLIIRTAMTLAWRNGQQLTQKLLEESIDTEMHHIIMIDRKDIPEKEIRILGAHFAGRALATMYLNMSNKLDKVTIHARMTELFEEGQWADLYKVDEKDKQQKIEYGAILTKLADDSIYIKTEELIINEAKALIAGFVAEELLLGSCGFSCHAKNHEIAYKLIEGTIFGGLSPSLVSKKVCEQKKEQAFALLEKCKKEVRDLLTDHLEALKVITDELLKKRILTEKEIQEIIDKTENKTATQVNESSVESSDTTGSINTTDVDIN